MTQSQSPFYVTTPIYYVNDKPHIGHAYTTILADVMSRYHRLLGEPTFFLTGTDEHGQKVEQAANKKDITPSEQCDATVIRFQELWRKLDITNDDFIRTTEERHKQIVSKILQKLYDQGEIYKADYIGSYCVPCERFFTEKDLVDGQCPDCKRPVEQIVESNYFFKMSQHQDWLKDYINDHPDFIQPPHRKNETLGFLKQPLDDLCISRPKSRLSWGIELPFDADYVCYVWFDALINYISAPGFITDDQKFQKWWPAACHLIGKDILTTHTVYWPIMLNAIGIAMPRSIFAHGWWLVGKDKMGKSLGNVVDPMEVCDRYGTDAFRYFLLAEMTPGNDASFTEKAFIDRYNTDLADGLGNMLNRVVQLINRHFDSKIPTPGLQESDDADLQAETFAAVKTMETSFTEMKLDRGLESVMKAVRACNRYFEITAPWNLAKQGNKDRLSTVLYTAAESLRIISALLYPIIPEKMNIMRAVLGIRQDNIEPELSDTRHWALLKPGTEIGDLPSLFPRIQVDKSAKRASQPVKNDLDTDGRNLIEITDFSKVKLVTARIVSAEKIENTKKLLKLSVDAGNDKRQIIAGIAESYAPENVVDKMIVIIANLKPATICGHKSEGMLLAAKNGKKLVLVTLDNPCRVGAVVG